LPLPVVSGCLAGGGVSTIGGILGGYSEFDRRAPSVVYSAEFDRLAPSVEQLYPLVYQFYR
jgi:hypothetical protein